MRIEAYTQFQQVYNTRKTNRSTASDSVGAAKKQLQISSKGKDLQTVKAALENVPDIREDLTESVKSKIQNGTYNVDNGSFAAKLLERYNALV